MANAIFGYTNQIETGTLAAGSEVSGLNISQLKTPQGASSTSWQTLSGANASWFTIDAGSSVPWRAFLLARTNLTSSAQARWRVGSTVEAVKEETPFYDFDFTAASPVLPSGWAFNTRGSTTGLSTYWDSTGTLQTATNTAPRITYDPVTLLVKGCLLEPTRTNSIRNPRLEGVATGSPGTLPTHWTDFVGPGLSRQIVTVGTSDGIPFMDIRIFGTVAAGGTNYSVLGDSVAVTSGQKWAVTTFHKYLPGSVNPPGSVWSYLGSSAQQLPTPNVGSLRSQRVSATHTAATTGSVSQKTSFYLSAGATDVTIRLGPIQAELGEFPTMPIFPPTGTPGAATRTFDYSTYPLTGFVQGAATVATEWSQEDTGMTSVADYANFGVSNSGLTYRLFNRFIAGVFNSGTSTWVSYSDSTEVVASVIKKFASTAQITPNAVTRLAAASSGTDNYAAAFNSSILTPTTDISGTALPTSFDTLFLYGGVGGIAYLRRARIYNKRLNNNQLKALTAASGIWSTLDTFTTTYDSGYISGVRAGYGQILNYSPSDISGQFARCDIMDTANTDNHISVGLAYAGPVWQPGINIGWESATNTTAMIDEVTTRGGQEYPQYRYEKRHWDVTLDNIATADLWTKAMEFYRTCRRGGNVLFCPDPTSDNMQRETVFGRGESLSDIAYVAQQTDYRSWRARVTERL